MTLKAMVWVHVEGTPTLNDLKKWLSDNVRLELEEGEESPVAGIEIDWESLQRHEA